MPNRRTRWFSSGGSPLAAAGIAINTGLPCVEEWRVVVQPWQLDSFAKNVADRPRRKTKECCMAAQGKSKCRCFVYLLLMRSPRPQRTVLAETAAPAENLEHGQHARCYPIARRQERNRSRSRWWIAAGSWLGKATHMHRKLCSKAIPFLTYSLLFSLPPFDLARDLYTSSQNKRS